MDDKKIKVMVVNGVEGNSLYVNGYRVAGNKPWGGGVLLHEFNVDPEEMRKALEKDK